VWLKSARKTRNPPGILVVLTGRPGLHQESWRNPSSPGRKTRIPGGVLVFLPGLPGFQVDSWSSCQDCQDSAWNTWGSGKF